MSAELEPVGPSNQASVYHARDMMDVATDSWVAVVRDVSLLAGQICDTEFVPKDLRPQRDEDDFGPAAARVTAVILHGRELGLPPMTALASTHLIEGRPSISAEVMRALIFQAGHEMVFVKSTASECIVKGRRRISKGPIGTSWSEWTEVTWNHGDAQRANLLSKKNWQTHPRRMYQARASAELAKLIFTDVIHGMRIAEDFDELVDVPPDETEQPAIEPPAETVRRAAGRNAPAAKRAEAQPGQQEQTPPPARKRPAVPPRGAQAPEIPDDGHPSTANLSSGEGAPSDGAPEDAVRDAAASEAEAAPDGAALPESSPPPSPKHDDAYDDDRPVGRSKIAQIQMHASRLGFAGDENQSDRHAILATLAGIDPITSTTDLTEGQALKALRQIEKLRDRAALDAYLQRLT